MILTKTAVALVPKDPIELFIFDWDTTLANIMDYTIAIVKKIFIDLELDVPMDHLIKEFMRQDLSKGIKLLKIPSVKTAKFIELYNFESTRPQLPNPYSGISKALDSLAFHGKKLVLITTQDRGMLYEHLRTLGFEKYFSKIYTVAKEADSHSTCIEQISKTFGVSKDGIVLIGGSLFDMQLASVGGVRTIACSYGLETAPTLLETKPAYLCHHPSHLCSLLQFKDLSFEVIREKAAQIDYYEFDQKKLSAEEREALLQDIYTVYCSVLKGRSKESFMKPLQDTNVYVLCAYNGFGHVRAYNIIRRFQITYPPESKLETDQYSLFTSFAVCVPDNSGKEFVNKSVIHHV